MPRLLSFATLSLVALSALAWSSLACTTTSAVDADDSLSAIESPLQYPSSRSAVRYQADRVRQDAAGSFVQIDLLVRNLHYGKDVGVRASIDGGAWC